jgi:hypothetical protein
VSVPAIVEYSLKRSHINIDNSRRPVINVIDAAGVYPVRLRESPISGAGLDLRDPLLQEIESALSHGAGEMYVLRGRPLEY